MNRLLDVLHHCEYSVPRACGDEPFDKLYDFPVEKRSPRMRG